MTALTMRILSLGRRDVVVRPLEEPDRPAAGALLAAAFPDKLAAMLGDRRGLARTLRGRPVTYPFAAALFADLLRAGRPPEVWVADAEGVVAGVVEVRDPTRPAARAPTWRVLRRHLGRRRALRSWLFQIVFHAAPLNDDRLHVDAVAVDPAIQRGGVGSALMRFVLDEAARRGKAAVTLYCIDRNDGARRFYGRLGFTVARRERLGPLRHLLGFAAADLMLAQVGGVSDDPPDTDAAGDEGADVPDAEAQSGTGTRSV